MEKSTINTGEVVKLTVYTDFDQEVIVSTIKQFYYSYTAMALFRYYAN